MKFFLEAPEIDLPLCRGIRKDGIARDEGREFNAAILEPAWAAGTRVTHTFGPCGAHKRKVPFSNRY